MVPIEVRRLNIIYWALVGALALGDGSPFPPEAGICG